MLINLLQINTHKSHNQEMKFKIFVSQIKSLNVFIKFKFEFIKNSDIRLTVKKITRDSCCFT